MVNMLGILTCAISICVISRYHGLWNFTHNPHRASFSFWKGLILKEGRASTILCRLVQPVFLVFFMFAELDYLRASRVRREAGQLAQFSSVVDATSTSEADRQAILDDIADCVNAVDGSIFTLLAAGMSTVQLRSAAQRGVDVIGAAVQRYALAWLGLAIWGLGSVFCCYGGLLGINEVDHHFKWNLIINMACLIVYVIIGICSESDKRAFLQSAVVKVEFFMFLKAIWELRYNRMTECRTFELLANHTTIFSVVAVVCAIAGMSGIARIPCLGRCIAGILSPGCRCCGSRRRGRDRKHAKTAPKSVSASALIGSEASASELPSEMYLECGEVVTVSALIGSEAIASGSSSESHSVGGEVV